MFTFSAKRIKFFFYFHRKFSLVSSKFVLQFSVVMKSSSIYQGKIAQTTNVPCHIFRLTVVWCDDVPAFDEHEQLCRTTVRTEHSVVSDSLHLTNISNIHTHTHMIRRASIQWLSLFYAAQTSNEHVKENRTAETCKQQMSNSFFFSLTL